MTTDYVGPLSWNDEQTRSQLGTLMTQLSSSYDGRPLDSTELDFVINSQNHEQLVAIRSGKVVGAASLSILPFSFDGTTVNQTHAVWLASVIVDENHRGKEPTSGTSIATQLWECARVWCVERSIPRMEFMTEDERPAAVRFYTKSGAKQIGSAWLFNVPVIPKVQFQRTPELAPLVYETCKSLLLLRLCPPDTTLSESELHSDSDDASSSGLRLIQYVAPSGSKACQSLLDGGLTPRRQEMVMRVEFS